MEMSGIVLEAVPAERALRDLLAEPQFAIMADMASLTEMRHSDGSWLRMDGRMVLVRGGLHQDALRALVYVGLELALWRRSSAESDEADALVDLMAAAKSFGDYLAIMPEQDAERCRRHAPQWLLALLDTVVPGTSWDAGVIGEGCVAVGWAKPSKAAIQIAAARFEQVRPLASPAAFLLLQGSDSRVDIDRRTGLNRYSTGPFPCDLTAFSSTTANPLEFEGLVQAETIRRDLIKAIKHGRATDLLETYAEGIRSDLAGLLGATECEAILASSGTAAALIAARLLLARLASPRIRLLVFAPEESGSGVELALLGRHPAGRTAFGHRVDSGKPIDPAIGEPDIVRLPIRDAAQKPLSDAEMLASLDQELERAFADDVQPILFGLEISKTGLAFPNPEIVRSIRERFGDKLPMMIDACQLRTDAQTIRSYLESACIVLVTGSKFWGGPPFCGALLVPARYLAAAPPLFPQLAAYSAMMDWPARHRGPCVHLRHSANIGLILRWSVALNIARAHGVLDREQLSRAGAIFSDVMATAARESPVVAIADRPERPSTIVSFELRDPTTGRALSEDELRAVTSLLRSGFPDGRAFLTGQAVALSGKVGTNFLRVSANLRLANALVSPRADAAAAARAELLNNLGDTVRKLESIVVGARDQWLKTP